MTDRRIVPPRDRRVSDRRQATRSTTDCQIRLLCATSPSQIVQGKLLDVSISGLRLLSDQSIAIGEKLLVEAKRGTRVVCNVTVQVVWAELKPNDVYLIGCESLTELSPRQLIQLKSLAVETTEP